DRPTPPHDAAQQHLVRVAGVPGLHPAQLVADAGVVPGGAGVHAADVLEAQVVPGEPAVPDGLHGAGGARGEHGGVVLRGARRARGAGAHARLLRRAHPLRRAGLLRLHRVAALPALRAVVPPALRLRRRLLPRREHRQARLRRRRGPALLRVHPRRHAARHPPLPCRGGDRRRHGAVSRRDQPVPGDPEDPQQPERQL
ncbi:hypothetical protein KEM52_004520, partial [Ascosphaera acerosa]